MTRGPCCGPATADDADSSSPRLFEDSVPSTASLRRRPASGSSISVQNDQGGGAGGDPMGLPAVSRSGLACFGGSRRLREQRRRPVEIVLAARLWRRFGVCRSTTRPPQSGQRPNARSTRLSYDLITAADPILAVKRDHPDAVQDPDCQECRTVCQAKSTPRRNESPKSNDKRRLVENETSRWCRTTASKPSMQTPLPCEICGPSQRRRRC